MQSFQESRNIFTVFWHLAIIHCSVFFKGNIYLVWKNERLQIPLWLLGDFKLTWFHLLASDEHGQRDALNVNLLFKQHPDR